MNRGDVELLLATEHTKSGQTDFVIIVSPVDVHSLATSLRHLMAIGIIDSYRVLDEKSGIVQINGYAAQP